MARKKKGSHDPRSAGKPEIEMGHRIRVLRQEAGISQAELGEKLGVSFQQVQKYEKGTNRVGAARLQLIASALQVPITHFYDAISKTQSEVSSLLHTDSKDALRLLRAYNGIKDQGTARTFVTLVEQIAASQPA